MALVIVIVTVVAAAALVAVAVIVVIVVVVVVVLVVVVVVVVVVVAVFSRASNQLPQRAESMLRSIAETSYTTTAPSTCTLRSTANTHRLRSTAATQYHYCCNYMMLTLMHGLCVCERMLLSAFISAQLIWLNPDEPCYAEFTEVKIMPEPSHSSSILARGSAIGSRTPWRSRHTCSNRNSG